jgi:hypothetical protein
MNMLRLVVISTALFIAPVTVAAAEPLAVFECREFVGRDWPRTLVTYQQDFPRGAVRAGNVRLLDASGREQPVQLWRVKTHQDGYIASARISFVAELSKEKKRWKGKGDRKEKVTGTKFGKEKVTGTKFGDTRMFGVISSR